MQKFNCDHCEFSTRYKSSFKRHLYHQHDTVLEEKRNCELCNIKFIKAVEYEKHRKRIHPTEEEIAHKKKLRADRARRYYVNKKQFNSAYQ